MLDRRLLLPREALDARDVVREAGVWIGLEELAPAVGDRPVVASVVELAQLQEPDLPAEDLECLARRAADRDDRRRRLFCERRSLHARLHEDERARRCVHALAVELEPRASGVHEVELLLPVSRVGRHLVVLVDDPVADGLSGPCVHAERLDAEVMANRPERDAAVVHLADLVQPRDAVRRHQASSASASERGARTFSKRTLPAGTIQVITSTLSRPASTAGSSLLRRRAVSGSHAMTERPRRRSSSWSTSGPPPTM